MKITGSALLSMLLFLQIFTLLGLYMAADSLLELKESATFWQKQTALLSAEYALRQVENQLLTQEPVCMLPNIAPITLAAQSLSWWQSSVTCHVSYRGARYFYVVESLDHDACALVNPVQKMSAHYYRVTLLGLPVKLILQSTMVKEDYSAKICEGNVHSVAMGRQRWTELKQQLF